ncbi:hypothetical protein EaACW_2853 [Erwinia amylovora ACW56400]|uniref:Uncharacterized protein n=1 Tax=Erwinia amylovora NBRC 12687 = CFBP 1232 TaxID=1219359 RepID=A0A830ZV96_ERWAM|nr:hypothetical protein EaACW_2853 [Erwinia amylovora ACW56400]CCO94838.1 hypothetical protein BN437_2928 [Erwinia amylovora NBRC 12687 = CFBP 1232]CCP00168.1 hypothetical protein BN438_2903 [Erwinia amylovora UPN527]
MAAEKNRPVNRIDFCRPLRARTYRLRARSYIKAILVITPGAILLMLQIRHVSLLIIVAIKQPTGRLKG